MYKVSELNPKDKTLDKIHKIQKKIYEEDKHLTPEEKRRKFIAIREEFSKEHKLNLKIVSLETSTK